MRVLLADGATSGGAEAVVEIARKIWWGWPLVLAAKLPGVMVLLRAIYRRIVANRYCAKGGCAVEKRAQWFDWLPLILLPFAAFMVRDGVPAWVFMWLMAAAIFYGCKWLTWRCACPRGTKPATALSLGYLFAWPGMDAAVFLSRRERRHPCRPGTFQADKAGTDAGAPGAGGSSNCSHRAGHFFRDWAFAATKIFIGLTTLWLATGNPFGLAPLSNGWLAMAGIVLLLHFGLFDLLALAWRRAGVNVQPIMRAPLIATSLVEFWGTRWNTAFNTLAHTLVFRPLARRWGVTGGTLGVFLVSGFVHEAVISLPARAGYGLPTAYFLMQGLGIWLERTPWCRRLGLGRGTRGWLFVLAVAGVPAFWLFHPPFIINVILPMLRAFGAT
jgi:alginate O-acetyltransferase complex protein AlgI